MYCNKCGAKVLDDDIFCFNCGSKLDSDEKIMDLTVDDQEFNNEKLLNKNVSSTQSELTQKHWYLLDPWKEDKPYVKKQIVKSVIVSNDTRKSVTSSIMRGAVGAAVLGPIGLLGGAISGKNKNETTFLLIYNTGEKKTVTVKTNGIEFKPMLNI